MLDAFSTSPAAHAQCAPLMDDMSDSTFASPILDRLLAGGVIDKAIYDAARDKLREQGAEPFSTLGGGLDWLEEEEVLSFEQMIEIEAKADADEGFASNAVRRQAVDEYNQDLELELALLQRQRRRHGVESWLGAWERSLARRGRLVFSDAAAGAEMRSVRGEEKHTGLFDV